MNSSAKEISSVGGAGVGKARKTGLASEKAATVRVNFDLDRDQHIKLKLYATRQRKSIKEVLSDYVGQLPEQGG